MNHQQIVLARRLVSWGTKCSFHRNSNRNLTTVTSSSLTHQHQYQLQPYNNNIRENHRRFFSNYNNEYDDNVDDNDYHDGMMYRQQTALVVGSSGSLGRCLVEHLSRDLKVRVIGADVIAPSSEDESRLTGGFVELPTTTSLPELTMALTDGLHQLIEDDQELDAVICVAGAWEGDPLLPSLPPPIDTIIENNEDDNNVQRLWLLDCAREYSENIERMFGKNLYPVLAAGYASQNYMTEGGGVDDDDNDNGGLFVAIGATAALSSTPGMLGYGLSKVTTHHYVQTLGETSGKAVTTKSKRKLARRIRNHSSTQSYLNRLSVVGILPTTIDTPANRQAMPNEDFSQWTNSIDIAKEIGLWMRKPALRPHSGSLVKVHPNSKGDGAEFKVAR
jgi:dihydropteridine reductase